MMQPDELFLLDAAVRIGTALLLGLLIGLERQRRQRMAGMRTNALVALGAALFVIVSVLTDGDASPTRIAAQVVSGIGFLGAGVIVRDGVNVRGLNTAATLWCSAAVGVLCGAGHPVLAGAGALAVLGVNTLVRLLAHRLGGPLPDAPPEGPVPYVVRAVCRVEAENRLRASLMHEASRQALRLRSLESADEPGQPSVAIVAEIEGERRGDDRAVEHLASRLSLDDAVLSVRWEAIDA